MPRKFYCTQVIRDKNNKIKNYYFYDLSCGGRCELKPDEVKEDIKNNRIVVENLTLTKDNRLLYHNTLKEPSRRATYYRYVIVKGDKELGGIFSSWHKLVDAGIDFDTIYNFIGVLENQLIAPAIDNENTVYYYTPRGRKRAYRILQEMQKYIRQFGFDINEYKKIGYTNIAYYDMYQIAERSNKHV